MSRHHLLYIFCFNQLPDQFPVIMAFLWDLSSPFVTYCQHHLDTKLGTLAHPKLGFFCHVILGIPLLCPSSTACESRWYFSLARALCEPTANPAPFQRPPLWEWFDSLLLLPPLFITNLGTESEHLQDVYSRDWCARRSRRITQQRGHFCFSLTSIKKKEYRTYISLVQNPPVFEMHW